MGDAVADTRAALFPTVIPPPPAGCFELGLVLGGTVSAGAYTAGALDLLIEALDAWHAANPPHTVSVKVAGGSSGGAVCAAILGLVSGRAMAPVHGEYAALVADQQYRNPFWNLWVNQFQIARLLAIDDLAAPIPDPPGAPAGPPQRVASLLDCRMIDESAADLVRFGQHGALRRRSYFAAPFRVAVTLANMRGIPFRAEVPTYGHYTGTAYLEHDDYAWFAFANGAAAAEARPDEFWLDRDGDYQRLADFATASAAMPLGLAARALTRPAAHYLWRPAVRATNGGPVIDWPRPDWSELPGVDDDSDYVFTSVDGGTFNNDPVRLVHRALAGLIGVNPIKPQEATRAMLMIDPLATQRQPIAPPGRSLAAVAAGIVGTMTQAARYLTADMELFGRDDVFSRFQLVPTRPEPGRVGEAALAGTSLGALAGFCAREVRVHDYLLGRSNMREYLRSELVLSDANSLFARWPLELRKQYAMDQNGDPASTVGPHFLPVVPVLPSVPQAAVPPWPKGALVPQALAPALRHRLESVLATLRADNLQGLLATVGSDLAIPVVAEFAANWIVSAWTTELRAAGLLGDP